MPRTTIRSEDITDLQVKTADIADSAVTAAKSSIPAFDDSGLLDDIALLAFKTQANGSLARYNLVDQSVDAFEDASGVDASASTNEIRNAANYYAGSQDATPTGGTETTHGLYSVNTFLANGNLVVGGAGNVDALVVAGGGGAGQTGGGGGAGGFRTTTTHAVTAQTYAIVVGAGGAGSSANEENAASGGVSTFSTITSAGGGGGGSYNQSGAAGGSGAGGGSRDSSTAKAGGAGNTPSTSPAQGFAGGAGFSSSTRASGGGGGASEVGVSCINAGNGGNGGDGSDNDYRTGSNVTYAGGGGGSADTNYGRGGAGGGGDSRITSGAGTPGTANTGGGGGGGKDATGGAGGSGIVVIRTLTSAWQSYLNMTLVSNAITAQAQPTKADVVLTYTDGAGTAVVNTDLVASVSRDNGTTYTAITLASQGTTGGHTILTAHDVDISGQPAGTSMRWKVATTSQSVSKQTRIQAVSLGWS